MSEDSSAESKPDSTSQYLYQKMALKEAEVVPAEVVPVPDPVLAGLVEWRKEPGLDWKGRGYYTETIDGVKCFVKKDSIESRWRRETLMIRTVGGFGDPRFPRFVKEYQVGNDHYLWVTWLPGLTLEQLPELTWAEFGRIIGSLSELIGWLNSRGWCHGDCNESNFKWDGKTLFVYDFEFCRPHQNLTDTTEDIFGVPGRPWGILHIIKFLEKKVIK